MTGVQTCALPIYSALGSYERNSTVPRLAEAVALADVLDVSLDFLLRGEAYRTLPLKNLTDEQTQLLLDLSVYFRQQNSADRGKKSMEPTKEQVALFAKLMKEVFG